MSWINELRKLKLTTRNKVRALLETDGKDSTKLLNKLRLEKSSSEILQIERVLRSFSLSREAIIHDLFPEKPQTFESFARLDRLKISKKLSIAEGLVSENYPRLCNFFKEVKKIDDAIISRQISLGQKIFSQLYEDFGYSHFLLRKAILLRTINATGDELTEIEDLLIKAGFNDNNVIVTSLINCYKEEQDFLGLKKSIMNLPDYKFANQFTRDITRLPFHPIAKDEDDLADLLQSCLQSSLIDAVISAKVNIHLVQGFLAKGSKLLQLFGNIEKGSFSIDEIASTYKLDESNGEMVFYQQSSAWLENPDIVRYRTLQDHFFNFPESDYFEFNNDLIDRINGWITPISLPLLCNAENFSKDMNPNLKLLEQNGRVTRSSLFNYCIHITDGYSQIEESDLIELMGRTGDLNRTINPKLLNNLAKLTESKLSKLILYLLIAKKSKNEIYDHQLRRILQDIVQKDHQSNIVYLLDSLNELSTDIARYTYDISTVDFLSQLYHILKSPSEVTEARAELHKWMGRSTGESSFIDRARTILIDHQINKIRNEIDDTRIYVDSARFAEWINDEVMTDLNSILTSLEHKQLLSQANDDPQLLQIVERCYNSFCSNTIFGIASYLGRRIRHGTFKGHLYSGVVKIELDSTYEDFLREPAVKLKWDQWKKSYEERVDIIIKDYIHIESISKRQGLIKPSLNVQSKQEYALVCAQDIIKDYTSRKSSLGAPQIITEYCWGLAEVDLKNINAFLKNQKGNLINQALLTELKSSVGRQMQAKASEFCTGLIHLIDERLSNMYNWFKRPSNVSPKVSLSLLYKAVVVEVKETYPDFETDTEFDAENDIELIGGAYLTIYDAFYVIIYNAAKHAKENIPLQRKFQLLPDKKTLSLEITSLAKDSESDDYINNRLTISPSDDINNAQASEDRSGIRKLHQLAQTNKEFSIAKICCQNRNVKIILTYSLAA